ncbi:hypothetical protein [Streptomyces ardesiacus]|uniref:hypothetical protein n=1 Tax=Streptomyces ardesiacus TaxID=285564 RepID=UPI003F49B7C3
MRQRIDGAGVFFAWFAVALWLLAGSAGVAAALGSMGALTAVIGVTPPALLMTFAAVVYLRQDRSLASS